MDDRTEPINETIPLTPVASTDPPAPPQTFQRDATLPLILFFVTCLTTYGAHGPAYAAALMFTLLAHELGHFIQAERYRVPASFPMFIPMPIGPLGTMGAVIGMAPHVGDRRSLFDIAITGPIAGLIPAIVFSVIGLRWSEVVDVQQHQFGLSLGEPLLFKLIAYLTFGPLPENQDIFLHPVAYAGWVGILITALNLFPIGQLDGGHILYAMLRKKAYPIALGLLICAAVAVVIGGYWNWTLMVLLLIFMRPAHPPTADDNVPLGPVRYALGWAALLFVPIGFTPVPFTFNM